MSEWITWIFASGWLMSLGTVPFIILSHKRPAGKLAWLWFVLLFPYFGPFCYLLFGSERIYRRHLRRRRNHSVRRGDIGEEVLPDNLSTSDQDLARVLSKLNIYSCSRVDTAELLVKAPAFYNSLHESIQQARSTIFIEFFIWRDDAHGLRLTNLLIEAAQRGVHVHVLADEMGCIYLSSNFFEKLRQAGGKFSWFNALHLMRNRWAFSLRNHRKLQIIDGTIAYVGGMNIGGEYMSEDPASGSWQDIQVKVTGPVVRSLSQTFYEDWNFATQENLTHEFPKVEPQESQTESRLVQVIEDGPDSTRHPMIHSMLAIFNSAQKKIWITAGYFFPEEPLLSALKLASMRGVDVRILIPAKSDHPYLVKGARFYYEELLSHGVRLYEYYCGTHHAKVILMDDNWVSIGSANFDIRSTRLNFELNLLFESPDLATTTRKVIEKDLAASIEIKLATFKERSTLTRLAENTCHLLGPLM